MDFWDVNKMTREPLFMIPLLKEMLGRLNGKKFFTKLDLVSAYHQIDLHKDSRMVTGFLVPGKGQGVWHVLFFGPKGAVTHFQKVMERALGDIDMDIVIVIYVDNILVVLDLVECHTLDVVIVIDTLTKAGLKLKLASVKLDILPFNLWEPLWMGKGGELTRTR